MSSPFIRACQATLDYDEGIYNAMLLWVESGKPKQDWPPDIKRWLQAHLEADLAYSRNLSVE